jgi:hypothetical protein
MDHLSILRKTNDSLAAVVIFMLANLWPRQLVVGKQINLLQVFTNQDSLDLLV